MSLFCWMLAEAIYLLMQIKPSLSQRNVPPVAWLAFGWGTYNDDNNTNTNTLTTSGDKNNTYHYDYNNDSENS